MKSHRHGAVLLSLAALFACSEHTPTGPDEAADTIARIERAATAVAFDHFVPAATGHEWANSYLLALLSHYVYVPLVGATSDDDFLEAFAAQFAPLGLSDFRVIVDPLTDAEVALAETDDALFIVFRGTEADLPSLDVELRDIYVDLGFVLAEHMHTGFTASALRVLDLVRSEIENTPGKRVWLTGHSLGGALATVTAQLLHAGDGITVAGVYTYGSPRVFDDVLANQFDQTFGAHSQRWVNNLDPVPHVGPSIPLVMPYQHVRVLNNIVPTPSGCTVRLDDAEHVLMTPEQWDAILEGIVLTDITTWGSMFENILALGDIDDHSTARYASRIYARMPADVRAAMPAPPNDPLSDNPCDGPQDITPPSIAPVVSGTAGNAGWYVSDVTVSWSVVDGESDIDTTEGCTDSTVTSDTNGVTFTCTATSHGGTATESVTIRRDATAPANIVTTPDRAPDHDGWYNASLAAAWSGTDAISGIASCTNSSYSGLDDGAATLSGTCTDAAGNTSEAVAFVFRYDDTAPAIAITSPPVGAPDYLRHQAVTAKFACTDATSGIASCAGTTADGAPLPTSAFGTHQLAVTAQDQAGNTANDNRGYTVTYGFDGFYAPVENLPAANVARAGQRIPFKWGLLDAAGTVADRTDLFHVTWSERVACDGAVAAVDLPGTIAESITGIRWDENAQQYIFVAATERSDGGTCRFLNVDVGAHARMQALVQFR